MKNKKVLLVTEDEPSLRGALRDTLLGEGFVVLEAVNGVEGVKTALRERPDLILLDILLPKMDGIAMMKTLRGENEWGKNVPIILLTNVSPNDENINKTVAENDPAYYLVKATTSIGEVVERIKERLSDKTSTSD
ncbi:MAG: Response regulator receiver protein [Parcubacteria group bacterium GW2011_GWA2_49_9]|nr:MAG: Response regulator receiver protein [Parcubacteria group bacterium GW2011_GWA2_49_9]